MFFNPWHAPLLALESVQVVESRLSKIVFGGQDAIPETRLMVDEKVAAVFETALILLNGGGPNTVLDHYRKQVAANAQRMSLVSPCLRWSGEFTSTVANANHRTKSAPAGGGARNIRAVSGEI